MAIKNSHPIKALVICLLFLLFSMACQQQDTMTGKRDRPALSKIMKEDRPRIEEPLLDYMEKADEDEFIPVIINLERRITQEEKRELFAKTHFRDKKKRRILLVEKLKQIAKKEQSQVLKFLGEKEADKKVRTVRPLWIVNAVGMQAHKKVIQQLDKFKEISSIHLDLPRPVKGEVIWGIQKIGADKVWNLAPSGYDGSGVIVGILDTGVDITHGDLKKNIWINSAEDFDGDGEFTSADNNDDDEDENGYFNDVVGWNSYYDNNDITDNDGHGTYIAGIVAGNGAGGTTTGVAPGAKVMCLKEANDGAYTYEQFCIDGIEYALENKVDIINFSSGWSEDYYPPPDYANWRETVSNLMDAGVLFVTISHNHGNIFGSPDNVATPGRVPLALTLGATDSSDLIWEDSNHGPVTWQDISPFFDYPYPPGLLKPDITAPGVDILSTVPGGDYGIGSGTSSSAAFASGVAALLLDKAPDLTPYEIKFILEETSEVLSESESGKDNVFGWGRIDAMEAIKCTIDPTPYDLSVTGTNALWTTSDIWVDNDDDEIPDTPHALDNNHLYARIRNIGGQVVSNAEVKFYYADVATIGISGFDPNGDGDPDDGNFEYIGSYHVPTLGPKGSRHEEAIALVHWNIPVPQGTHWCVGIGIVAPDPPNAPEGNTSNNTAFKNFFDIVIEGNTAAFDFEIMPLQNVPAEPFALEFVKKNIPEEVVIELVIDKEIEKQIIVKGRGLAKKETLFPKIRLLNDAYYKELEKQTRYVRYVLKGEQVLLEEIVSPKGDSYPARVIIRLPDKFEIEGDMFLVINTLDKRKKPAGGLALRINR